MAKSRGKISIQGHILKGEAFGENRLDIFIVCLEKVVGNVLLVSLLIYCM